MNRAQRRQMARAGVRDAGQKATQPTGDFGIEVDSDDNTCTLTLHQGNFVGSIRWQKSDGMVVADMIRKACEGGELKPVEVVRSSGIVVAKELP